MNIYPNLTLVLLQLVPFVLTLIALNAIIFKPMLKYLEDRENASSGAEEQAKSIHAEIDLKVAELQEKINVAQQQASLKRSAARENLVKNYNDVVQESRKEADQKIKDAALVIAAEQSAARQEIKVQAKEIATQIASQTLGRNITVG
jgi:F-type H+-transporting ATPase subunit b